MKGIINYFLERSFVVNIITVFVCIFGLISFYHARRDLIPQMEIKMVSINASLIGASPIDVERNITFPIEESIKNVTGVKSITSSSYNSGAYVRVTFKDDFDNMSDATEEIKSLVSSIRGELPSGMEPIHIEQLKVDSVTAMKFSMIGVDKNSNSDRSWVLKFEESLRSVSGVVSVENTLKKREIFIDFSPAKIQRHNVPVSQIRSIISAAISYMPVASFDNGPDKVSIELKNQFDDIEKIKRIPIVTNRSGDTLYLKDFADVSFRFPKIDTIDLLNGEDYVMLEAKKDLNSDIIAISKKLKKTLSEFEKDAPKHIKVKIQDDTSIFLKKQLSVLKTNALLGLILVCLTLYFLLGARISLVTVFGLPFSYFGTFVILSFFNVSIDLISVVGLILVIGILVDDAIVVSEQYVQNLERGLSSRKAAYEAARATIVPVTGTVLTTAVAFGSLLILSSSASQILFAIPCVVISSLFLSWFESFYILPNHLQHFVKSKSKRSDGKLFIKLKAYYVKGLRACLKLRYLFLVGIVVFLGISFFVAASKLEKSFGLRIGNEYLLMDVALKKSESMLETKKKLAPIHDYLNSLSKDEIQHFDTRIGKVWRNHREFVGSRYARIYLQLKEGIDNPKEIRKRLEGEISKKLKTLKTDEYDYLYVRSVMKGDEKNVKDIVTVYVSGRDRMPFEKLQNEIKTSLKSVKGITDIFVEEDKFRETWQFYPNFAELMRYRLSGSELALQLRENFSPQELSQLRMNGENTYIYTQYSDLDKLSFKDLSKISVQSPIGESIPTSFLGKWKKAKILKNIQHEDLRRKIEIDVRYDKKEVKKKKLANEIDNSLKVLRKKYPMFDFSVIKVSREERENIEWMKKVALLSVGLIIFILILCLNSIVQPLIVASVIPFGVIGVIWALYFHSLPLGIMAIIGIVGMAGVVVNDSLIMVDAINRESKGGQSMKDHIVDGASSRLRPIIITTVTTLGGVFPMAYGLGGEVGFTRPLAFSMGWGLLFATTLTLFFLPALLMILNDFKNLGKRVAIKLFGRFLLDPQGEPKFWTA